MISVGVLVVISNQVIAIQVCYLWVPSKYIAQNSYIFPTFILLSVCSLMILLYLEDFSLHATKNYVINLDTQSIINGMWSFFGSFSNLTYNPISMQFFILSWEKCFSYEKKLIVENDH